MKFAWVLVVVLGIGMAAFMYRYAGQKPAHSVTLQWAPAPSATSYGIYRATKSGGPYLKIGRAFDQRYVDHSVTSGAVFYYVVTTDRNGKESGYSQEVRAAVP